MQQIVVSGTGGRLARGWGVDRLHEAGQLEINFFQFSYGMAQSAEAGIAVGRKFVGCTLVYLAIVVSIVIVNEGGQDSGSAGLRKGVGDRVLELKIKCFPFLK